MNKRDDSGMKKKIVFGAVVISILLGVATGVLIWHQNKAQAFDLAALKAVDYVSSDQISFNGEVQMLKEPKYQSTFKTVVNEESSMTTAQISYPSLFSENKVDVQVMSVNGKNYIKIAKVDAVLESLPKDPLSRSIAVNLEPIISQYQNKWIQLDEVVEISQSMECVDALRRVKLSDQLKSGRVKLNEYVKLLKKKTVSVNDESATEYQFNVTNIEKLLSNQSVNSTCTLNNAQFTLQVAKDGELKQMTVKTKEAEIRITPGESNNQDTISEPTKSVKYSDLKKQIDVLFLK